MRVAEKLKLPLWVCRLLSLLPPAALFLIRPLGMSPNQSFLLAALVLVIIWWSTGLVPKLLASCALLGAFALFSPAPLTVVFSFPLSETFLLIVLSYLFSQGIENSGLAERILEPLLARWASTPLKAMISVVLVLISAFYIIPQPLARLIILAAIYRGYLAKTDAPENTKAVIMFSIFALYVQINMMALDADIILNTAAAGFAGVSISNAQWISYMGPPTLLFCAASLALICAVFRKELRGVRLSIPPREKSLIPALTPKERLTIAVIAGTVLLWAAGGLLGSALPVRINPVVVTLVGILLLFALGVLRPRDIKSVDVTTLVFISAAFSIGGVLKAAGVAEIVFSRVAALFPSEYSASYVATVVLVSMGMHMLLGSNTTTLSVVLPGLVMIGSGVISDKAALFLGYTSVVPHYLLPFHAVSMMIGSSHGYFPTGYVVKYGSLLAVLGLASIALAYLPWWRFMGLI